MNPRSAPLVLTVLLLSSCSLAPHYERPAPPVPASWSNGSVEQLLPEATTLVAWQDFFTDARLREVIELALASNRDLRIAALTAEKVQAAYRIQRSELYPGVGVMASGDVYKRPATLSDGGQSETVEQYAVQLGTLSWEIDLFGRLRSLKEGALERFLASEEAHVATQLTVVASTAISYLALAADQQSLALARTTLAAYQSSLDLIRQSQEVGIGSDLDLAQARSQVSAARAAVAQLEGAVARDRNALELLVGGPVPAELLPDGLAEMTAADNLAAGLPSEVLLGRPDILAAEHQLKAANAQIGAARAAFFPSISLTAGVGTMSSSLDELFGSGSGTWSFAPQLLTPIFASGALKANLQVAEVDRELAVARYEQAIQVAFREVSDALVLRTSLLEQRDAQQALVQDLETGLRLSDTRYQVGLDSYLGVLVAQRSLYAAQQAEIAVRLAEQANLVTLYKALGGGAS